MVHPLIARIPPALRCALLATLVGKFVLLARGYNLPAWDWYEIGWIAAEWLLAMAGTWSVYHVIRKQGLPQTAERAGWLWATFPLVALMPAQDLFWVVLPLMGFALAMSPAYPLAAIAWAASLWHAPNTLLIGAMVIWGASQVKDPLKRAALVAGPILAAAGLVLYHVLEGSLRDFQAFQPRQDWDVLAWQVPEWLGVIVPLAFIGLALTYARRLPTAWTLASVVTLVLVAVQTGPFTAALALPVIAGHFALSTENPQAERTVIGLQIASLALL